LGGEEEEEEEEEKKLEYASKLIIKKIAEFRRCFLQSQPYKL